MYKTNNSLVGNDIMCKFVIGNAKGPSFQIDGSVGFHPKKNLIDTIHST